MILNGQTLKKKQQKKNLINNRNEETLFFPDIEQYVNKRQIYQLSIGWLITPFLFNILLTHSVIPQYNNLRFMRFSTSFVSTVCF